MSQFTLLTKEQVFGDTALEVLRKYGTEALITDFSILLYGHTTDPYELSKKELKNLTGYYWIMPDDGKGCTVSTKGYFSVTDLGIEKYCYRPVILSPDSSKILIKERKNDILEVEYDYFEYPQTVAPKKLFKVLEELYNKCALKKTGKSYSTRPIQVNNRGQITKVEENLEYEYNGKKYVRIYAWFDRERSKKLSNRERYHDYDYVWVEVEPIRWLFDEKTNTLISKKLLFSGIPFTFNNSFENITLFNFINTYFAKQMVNGSKSEEKIEIPLDSIKVTKNNHYNFNSFDLTENEIMIGAIKSGFPLLIHGESASSKISKIKALDPNCVIIDLKTINESALIGLVTSDFEKKETICVKPWWYNEICKICEEEPNKIHILYFDDLTELYDEDDKPLPLSSIEKLAFGIVINRKFINSSFEYKLPPNCRIVASTKTSLELAKESSFYDEFIHVYMDQRNENWVELALKKPSNNGLLSEEATDNIPPLEYKIHPSICAYLAWRGMGSYFLKDTNFKQWEMASKMLYKTKNLHSMKMILTGEYLLNDFYTFCKISTISIEEVIENEHIEFSSTPEKYLTVAVLSEVNEEDVEIVRNFVKDMGVEFENLFDSLWTYDNPKRLEIIERLKEEQNVRSLNK